MKRSYELTVVLRLDNDETLRENIQQVKDWIEADGLGTVNKVDTNFFGRRRLAYEIDGQREGYYVIFHAEIDGTANEEIERELRLAPFVLRHLIIRGDE
ncbi:MAG: 30S ribosomal protein S6 [Anaerolineaceae bacterium]|nr:MAG: 30S ribosomal protein S6 [Anaerolineaceae bacterium]